MISPLKAGRPPSISRAMWFLMSAFTCPSAVIWKGTPRSRGRASLCILVTVNLLRLHHPHSLAYHAQHCQLAEASADSDPACAAARATVASDGYISVFLRG